MVKAVIFDWGNVLIANKEKERMEYCARKLGTTVEKLHPLHNKYLPLLDSGAIDEETFWLQVQKELSISHPKPYSIWGEALAQNYTPYPQMWQLVKNLKKNGYLVALLSNCEKPVLSLTAKKEYQIFDAKVFSCLEGVRKPEAGIYRLALERLDVKAEEAVFIDDREDYVQGAKMVGLRVIWYKTSEQTIKELKTHGVKLG